MIDRAFFTAGSENMNRDLLSRQRKWTLGQRFESGVPTNSPVRTVTLAQVPQFTLLCLGTEDSPQGAYDVVHTGYAWSQSCVSGADNSGAGGSTIAFGRRTGASPSKTFAVNGAGGSGTGYEECCVIEIPGLLGEVIWQGQVVGTSTVLTTPAPKRGYWVPGCLLVILGRWRSGGASGFSSTISTAQTPLLGPLMGNIGVAWLYRYLPGSRPTSTITYARSVLASAQAAIIR